MFDYLIAPGALFHEQGMGSPLQILYAGNLAFGKARYLYRSEIGELNNVRLSVFGPRPRSTFRLACPS